MAVNKVIYGTTVLVDLTEDTVTPSALAEGYTAHDRSGAAIVGTATGGSMVIRDTEDSHGGTIRSITAGSVVQGTKTITENGTYDVAEFADANVNVPAPEPELQAKTATPSTSQQTITADSGYDGLSQVTVAAMPSGSATTPTTSITANPSISVNSSTGLITASVSGSKSVTPSVSAGYVSSGTAGTVSVSGSNTSQLTTQAAKTVTPSTSSQTAVAAGRYTTGAVTVAAMPSGTAGTPTATKGTVSNHAISVTPSVTNATGYITGGTKNGTAVTVSASELVGGTLSVTENGTVDVTNFASASVNVPTSNDFVVTITYDSTSQMYEPDKTLTEIDAAYTSGKRIVVQAFDEWGNLAAVYSSYDKFGSNMGTLYYSVYVSYADELESGYECHWHTLDTNGLHNDGASYYRDTSIATAVAADVANGKTFFGASGYETGTASSGGGDELKAMIQRTANVITELPSDITTIGNGAFYYFSTLGLTSLPSGVTSIGDYAFYNCGVMRLPSLPSGVTTIGQYAFSYCSSLTLSSLPSSLTSLGSSAFFNCNGLTQMDMSATTISSIKDRTFSACHGLASVSIPSTVISIGTSAFNSCKELTSVSCNGAITTLGIDSFTGSSSAHMQLERASFPNAAILSLGTAFGSTTAAKACQELETVDIGSTSAIAANAFANCYALQTLVLRKSDAICTLSNVSAFTNTPMRGYNSLTGTVYVPSALISTYQTATNWSTLYNDGTVTFAAIEGSEYEL